MPHFIYLDGNAGMMLSVNQFLIVIQFETFSEDIMLSVYVYLHVQIRALNPLLCGEDPSWDVVKFDLISTII